MSYKSLFTVLTEPTLVANTLENAIAMAEAHDAHLDVMCLGVDISQTGYHYAGASAIVLQESLTRAHENARSLEDHCKEILGKSSIRWATEVAVSHVADLSRHVAARARFSDISILPKPYGEDRGSALEAVTEATMFQGQTATIILPENARPLPKPERIMIAWNESAEALNAVRAAMPLLQTASHIHVTVIDPPTHGPNRSDPGGQLSQYLARHDLRIEIDILAKTLPRVSDVILRHISDMDADMLVMGAYGHSRFREALFGGATRRMLEAAPIPVLMAH